MTSGGASSSSTKVKIKWTDDLVERLLDAIARNPQYRDTLWPDPPRPTDIFPVTTNLCLEVLHDQTAWLEDIERRGLLKKDEKGNWKPTKIWTKTFRGNPIHEKLFSLSHQYMACREKFELKAEMAEEGMSDELKASILKVFPYYFMLCKASMGASDSESPEIPSAGSSLPLSKTVAKEKSQQKTSHPRPNFIGLPAKPLAPISYPHKNSWTGVIPMKRPYSAHSDGEKHQDQFYPSNQSHVIFNEPSSRRNSSPSSERRRQFIHVSRQDHLNSTDSIKRRKLKHEEPAHGKSESGQLVESSIHGNGRIDEVERGVRKAVWSENIRRRSSVSTRKGTERPTIHVMDVDWEEDPTLTTQMLDILLSRDSYRIAIFGHDPYLPRWKAERDLCIKLMQHSRIWMRDTEKKGLIGRPGDYWRATTDWTEATYNPVSLRLEQLTQRWKDGWYRKMYEMDPCVKRVERLPREMQRHHSYYLLLRDLMSIPPSPPLTARERSTKSRSRSPNKLTDGHSHVEAPPRPLYFQDNVFTLKAPPTGPRGHSPLKVSYLPPTADYPARSTIQEKVLAETEVKAEPRDFMDENLEHQRIDFSREIDRLMEGPTTDINDRAERSEQAGCKEEEEDYFPIYADQYQRSTSTYPIMQDRVMSHPPPTQSPFLRSTLPTRPKQISLRTQHGLAEARADLFPLHTLSDTDYALYNQCHGDETRGHRISLARLHRFLSGLSEVQRVFEHTVLRDFVCMLPHSEIFGSVPLVFTQLEEIIQLAGGVLVDTMDELQCSERPMKVEIRRLEDSEGCGPREGLGGRYESMTILDFVKWVDLIWQNELEKEGIITF